MRIYATFRQSQSHLETLAGCEFCIGCSSLVQLREIGCLVMWRSIGYHVESILRARVMCSECRAALAAYAWMLYSEVLSLKLVSTKGHEPRQVSGFETRANCPIYNKVPIHNLVRYIRDGMRGPRGQGHLRSSTLPYPRYCGLYHRPHLRLHRPHRWHSNQNLECKWESVVGLPDTGQRHVS